MVAANVVRTSDKGQYVQGADGPIWLPSNAEFQAARADAQHDMDGNRGFSRAVSSSSYRGSKVTTKTKLGQDLYVTGALSDSELSQLLGHKRERDEKAEKAATKRRAIHAACVEVLSDMKDGEYGWSAEQLGEKWHEAVKKCGGRFRVHGPCGQASYSPHSCSFPLCPWFQHAKAIKQGARIEQLWTAGYFEEPMLGSFTTPNTRDLRGAWSAQGKVMSALHRRKSMKACKGGIRSMETTYNAKTGLWHPHVHELMDSAYLNRYPFTKIDYVAAKRKRNGSLYRVKRVESVPGVARDYTELCLKYPALVGESGCKVRDHAAVDLDCPDCWYFIDIRRADRGSIAELAKYTAKGSDIINAGPNRMLDYLEATKGKQLLKGFGTLWGVKVTRPEFQTKAETDEELDAAYMAGEFDEPDFMKKGNCPYDNCPYPAYADYAVVSYGPPTPEYLETQGLAMVRNPHTGTYRIEPVSEEIDSGVWL